MTNETMAGRIKRKQAETAPVLKLNTEDPVCPLCERPIPRSQRDAHHLVPKSRGGRVTEYLHRICHKQVHALLTEKELERNYHTAEALLAHPEMRAFIEWVKSKPPSFSQRTFKSQRIRKKRHGHP